MIRKEKEGRKSHNLFILSKEMNLNENMLRTVGAEGILMQSESAKKVIRRRASMFIGTDFADSLTVRIM